MAHGLYLHVPFCQSICSYCNFNRGVFDRALADRYVAALEQEIRRSAAHVPVDTIFFGGGTPSILEPAAIARLIGACADAFDVARDAEVTLETNPETVTTERMRGFRDAGVNRISLGAQSFDAGELRRLERAHAPERIGQAVAAVRTAGFDNVSLDLMLWLPGQSRMSCLASVEQAVALEPDHLSLYLLELYPNSPLKEAMARAVAVPGATPTAGWSQEAEDEAAAMYLDAFDRLDGAGFVQYEISNAARPGRESQHNLKYWTGGSWWGFGCGAHATVEGRRWHNVAATGEYVARIEAGQPVAEGIRTLDMQERAEEALFTGLRLSSGIDRQAFRWRFGLDPWDRHADILTGAEADGLVWRSASGFGLTRSGMLVSNEILHRLLG